MENAAVPIVGDFLRGVDADACCEGFRRAVGGFGGNGCFFAGSEAGYAADVENFMAGETEGFASFAGEKFERENAHADEIAAVDAFVAFG